MTATDYTAATQRANPTLFKAAKITISSAHLLSLLHNAWQSGYNEPHPNTSPDFPDLPDFPFRDLLNPRR